MRSSVRDWCGGALDERQNAWQGRRPGADVRAPDVGQRHSQVFAIYRDGQTECPAGCALPRCHRTVNHADGPDLAARGGQFQHRHSSRACLL
jgi:hypothetical protein